MHTTQAQLHRSLRLGNGMGLANWSNNRDEVHVNGIAHHTVSLYLAGGDQIYRKGINGTGSPGKFCFMPAETHYEWDIHGHLEFVHLYIPQNSLQQMALERFDWDPRKIDLPDLTFHDDMQLQQIFQLGFLQRDWNDSSELMMFEEFSHIAMLHILKHHVQPHKKALPLTAGLSPVIQRRVREYIDTHLHTALTIKQLASEAQLSEFHFARMFAISFAQTPHQYILKQRILRSQALLKMSHSLADIALQVGFSSQSHFSRQFKKATGYTPRQFRQQQ